MSLSIPYDAVLFDLDGTLVATDRFWPQAARAGALLAFEELGLERQLPTTQEWMSMVGLPLEEGFDAVFDDLTPEQREHLMRRCVEVEHEFLDQGHAVCLPGVEETLEELRASGKRLGIASNCGRDYLHAMMHGLGLARWIEEGRCLDSPGIRTKADMIQDLLETFGTRSAVMVGDRVGDRDSAWANGVPHVHLARGYARSGEEVLCEAVIDGFDELLPRLALRDGVLDDCVRRLDLLEPSLQVLGICGPPGAGKTLLARELSAKVQAAGRPSAVHTLDEEERHPVIPTERQESLSPGGLLIVEGRWLGSRVLAPHGGRLLRVVAHEQLLLRRIEGRDGRLSGPMPVQRAREELLPEAAAFAEEAGPSTAVLDTTNLLEPRLR